MKQVQLHGEHHLHNYRPPLGLRSEEVGRASFRVIISCDTTSSWVCWLLAYVHSKLRVRSRVGITAAAAIVNVGEPDRCQSCGEDVDDYTLLFIHNRGEVIDYTVPSFRVLEVKFTHISTHYALLCLIACWVTTLGLSIFFFPGGFPDTRWQRHRKLCGSKQHFRRQYRQQWLHANSMQKCYCWEGVPSKGSSTPKKWTTMITCQLAIVEKAYTQKKVRCQRSGRQYVFTCELQKCQIYSKEVQHKEVALPRQLFLGEIRLTLYRT